MMSMQTGPTQAFVDLCETLYGPVVDPHVVWDNVHKADPDQADLHVQRQARIRRNVERSSNAVGIAAGSLGLAGSLKDDRLAEGTGRVSRALTATGRKLPKLAARVKNTKVRAAMAATAVGTQVANLGGDALIAGTLKDGAPKKRKVEKTLVPTGVDKGLPDMKKVVQGIRMAWNPNTAAAAATPPKAGTRAAAKATRTKNQQAMAQVKHEGQGADAARMLSTNSGKAVTGTLAATGVAAGGKKLSRKTSYEYVPDTYAKADGNDVVFKGQFTDFDDDKRQAFGWASVVKINGVPVVDRQGDYIDLDDLETAAYGYVHKSRVGGDMHRRNGDAPHKVSDMIESMVITDEKARALGMPDNGPRGWWVGYQIHDESTWQEVRKKGRTGFSIHGRGIRKDVDVDELMGAR